MSAIRRTTGGPERRSAPAAPGPCSAPTPIPARRSAQFPRGTDRTSLARRQGLAGLLRAICGDQSPRPDRPGSQTANQTGIIHRSGQGAGHR